MFNVCCSKLFMLLQSLMGWRREKNVPLMMLGVGHRKLILAYEGTLLFSL